MVVCFFSWSFDYLEFLNINEVKRIQCVSTCTAVFSAVMSRV